MLTKEEARALITTSLSDEDLEAVIAREEAWLARRVGPLDGERVDTFVTPDGDEVLRLRRPALAPSVEDDSGERTGDVELRGWSDVVVLDTAAAWSREVRVSYVPADEEEVKHALITLVRLTLGESAYASQSAGGYSSSVSVQDQRTMRYAAWRSLLRPAVPTTVRMTSAIPAGGNTVSPVAVAPVGS